MYGTIHVPISICTAFQGHVHGTTESTLLRFQSSMEGGAWIMLLLLMPFTFSTVPSRSDPIQELVQMPLKNNCKMKQIALSGGQ